MFSIFLIRPRISDLPRPIAAKLCHVISISVNFIMQVQKILGARPYKILGPKTCKIWCNFTQLATLIADISRTRQYIQNWKDMWLRPILPTFSETSPVNFGPRSSIHVSLDPPKSTFSGDYISAPRWCWHLKYVHALDLSRLASAHHKPGRPPQKKKLRANI